MTQDLEPLRQLHAAMVAAERAYHRAEPDVVHHAHAALRSARFRYSRACGEYVAELLEVKDE